MTLVVPRPTTWVDLPSGRAGKLAATRRCRRCRLATVLAACATAAALAACGGAASSAGRKADSHAYAGADNPYVVPGWKLGEEASWNEQIRNRAQNQNEYARSSSN